jgi:hypothetical protein
MLLGAFGALWSMSLAMWETVRLLLLPRVLAGVCRLERLETLREG